MPVRPEFVTVEAVQTFGRAYPDKTSAVLYDGMYGIGRQTAFHGIAVEIKFYAAGGNAEKQQKQTERISEHIFHKNLFITCGNFMQKYAKKRI
jgi:predicted ATPase